MTNPQTCMLGCIADDVTGGTDLALMLAQEGMRTVQLLEPPQPGDLAHIEADAVVVALKIRSIPAAEASAQALRALRGLRGCRQYFWKYCSTFDSTEQGNIGPVAETLLDELGAPFTIFCPAFPANARTVYQGHLFVADALLSDSPMRHHPLNPMADGSLLRLLAAQSPHTPGLIAWSTVRQGPEAIRQALASLRAAAGCRFIVIDALEDADLRVIGEACADLPLITGGSGVAMGLPDNFRRQGLLRTTPAEATALPQISGRTAILAGSCSAMTLRQLAHLQDRIPAFTLDPLQLASSGSHLAAARAWLDAQTGPVLIASSTTPAALQHIQEHLGVAQAGQFVEHALADLARHLHAQGVRRFVVAGGETSGAVVQALNVRALRIGPAIDPGVPWTVSTGPDPISLVLKSGNFGAKDFFTKVM